MKESTIKVVLFLFLLPLDLFSYQGRWKIKVILLKLKGKNYLEDTSDVVNSRELFEHQKCLWMADYKEEKLTGLCGPQILKWVKSQEWGEKSVDQRWTEGKKKPKHISGTAEHWGPWKQKLLDQKHQSAQWEKTTTFHLPGSVSPGPIPHQPPLRGNLSCSRIILHILNFGHWRADLFSLLLTKKISA